MYRRTVRFKHNHRSLSVKLDDYDLKQIPDADTKKVEALKKLISDGDYTVPAEDLAPKLMEAMFRSTILDDAPNGASCSQLEADDQAAPKVNGGAMVSRKDSRWA
jgi:hypothetical protein